MRVSKILVSFNHNKRHEDYDDMFNKPLIDYSEEDHILKELVNSNCPICRCLNKQIEKNNFEFVYCSHSKFEKCISFRVFKYPYVYPYFNTCNEHKIIRYEKKLLKLYNKRKV